MEQLLILLAIVVALAFAMVLLKWVVSRPRERMPDEPPFRAVERLLSDAEWSFYQVLSQVNGPLVILVKVRLLDLVSLPPGTPSRQALLNRVMSKHVDFLLCEREGLRPALVIELDDSSHQKQRQRERDDLVNRVLANAGIPMLRVAARRSYNTRELSAAIQSSLGEVSAPVNEAIRARPVA